ncbi:MULTISPECIES: conjugal transfer protein TrbI [unclassified Nostoc]|uniref:conjugal transfer protein TrbI n=1 Tax=unclassified Nostoc TaxID=2593658 RepID=UPI002AD1EF7B|nr:MULTISPECIES: conjugal transfer protein TrbI [unclassified Nostoc]MDZ8031086.1 conjugal transfer protein TrbI [Nostoc sp. DedSLP04]MDZ8091937.1 conjugal transfer protein TrbI [Nostoc sp. DedQUE05]MDZ8216150.1 conjugal transfer protein TrbI [Nostoc sp. ChiSLP03a]
MTRIHQWKSGTAALMAMAVTTSLISPLLSLAPANAQYRIDQNRTSQYGNVTIPSGVALPVTYEKETITIAPGESKSLTLRIANDIIDRNRNVLIPAGTKVNGRLESVDLDSYSRDTRNDDNQGKGVRFVAQELEFSNGQRQSINATSRTYTTTQRVSQKPNTTQVLTDAAIGGGAGLLGSLITGNRKIDDLKPVIGAAAGAGASVLLRKKEGNAFVLRPEQDLRLTLNSNLNLVPQSRY